MDVELHQCARQKRKSQYLMKILVSVVGVMLIATALMAGYEMGKSSHGVVTPQDNDAIQSRQKRSVYEKEEESWIQKTCEQIAYPSCPEDYKDETPFLLISLDGFRMDYLKEEVTPGISKLVECGVTVPYLRSSFPTNTFPNHYTIATGLYPEHHGIVENNFKDPNIPGHFSLGDEDALNPDYWWGEPIWNTVMKQGKTANTFFWPGSDVEIGGMYPNWTLPYNGSVPFEERVDTVVEWMARTADERPDFSTLYFDEPDHLGHAEGSWSTEVKEKLKNMDKIIDRLMQGLEDNGILGCVNMIILADHGMTTTSCDSAILVNNLNTLDIDITQEGYLYAGSFGRINLDNDTKERRDELQSHLSCKDTHMRVYQKDQVPKRRHYSYGDRISGIQMELDPRWSLSFSSNSCLKGQHGYDNIHHEMGALFLGSGPAFKTYEDSDGDIFENVELYNLMCAVMGITPAENDGTQGSLFHLLRNPPPYPSHQDEMYLPMSEFPKTDMIYRSRYESAKCDCLPSFRKQKKLDSSLPSPSDYDNLIKKHLPWGTPAYNVTDKEDLQIALHVQKDFVTGYSKSLKIPLWTSFTLTNWKPDESPPLECPRADARLEVHEAPSCDWSFDTDIFTPRSTFPQRWSSSDETVSDGQLISSMLPMKDALSNHLLETMYQNIDMTYRVKGSVNVIVGPVFDEEPDDNIQDNYETVKKKKATPSDYFMILAQCKTDDDIHSCPASEIEVFPVVLPMDGDPNQHCQAMQHLLMIYTVRVRDIENLTGLTFYTNNYVTDDIVHRLRTQIVSKIFHPF